MFKQIKLDALLAGFISIFFVFIANMAIIITALSLLSDYISADVLHMILKIITVISLAIPPYVAARTSVISPVLHGLITGIVETLIVIGLMTQTAGWDGTQQDNIIAQMPLVGGSLLVLSLVSGLIGRWMNQKDQS